MFRFKKTNKEIESLIEYFEDCNETAFSKNSDLNAYGRPKAWDSIINSGKLDPRTDLIDGDSRKGCLLDLARLHALSDCYDFRGEKRPNDGTTFPKSGEFGSWLGEAYKTLGIQSKLSAETLAQQDINIIQEMVTRRSMINGMSESGKESAWAEREKQKSAEASAEPSAQL